MHIVPVVQLIAACITALYGLISLIGGYIGYAKAGSTASLIAGGISGVLLLLCAGGVFVRPTWSLIGALVVSLALVGRFASVLAKESDHLGQVLNEGKGITAYVMITCGALVVAAAGLALLAGPTQSSTTP